MAIRKRDKQNNAKLRRRLRYHGLDLPTSTNEERAKARGAIVKAKNAKKRERSDNRLIHNINIYNQQYKERNTLKLQEAAIKSLPKDKKKKIASLVNKLNRREEIGKNRDKLISVLSSMKPRKGDEGKSIRIISSDVENRARRKVGMLSLLDEVYYNNFLKACLRKGAFSIYRKAKQRGYSWVIDLYNRGFDINDLYEYGEQGVSDAYYSDKEVEDFLSGTAKVPRVSSEIGQAVAAKFKIR